MHLLSYHPETLKEILAAKKFFENTPGKYYSFLIACTLHILHGNRPYALEGPLTLKIKLSSYNIRK
jgi:hypothetical protein